MGRLLSGVLLAGAILSAFPHAQAPPPLEFDVISIKRNPAGPGFMESRTLPDRTMIIVNGTLDGLVRNGGAVPVLPNNVVGLPDWIRRETYDVTAKPPAGATPEQIRAMWQKVLKDRMNFAGHIEEREVKVFSLVLARSDGRLGPGLKKSTLDCGAPSSGGPPPPPAQSVAEVLQRCGMMGNGNSVTTGGMTMERLAMFISGRAGGPVTDKTGLSGYYTFHLTFSPPHAADAPINPDDPPEFFVALEEQLGLKLETGKGTVPYLIVDHVDRPTEN